MASALEAISFKKGYPHVQRGFGTMCWHLSKELVEAYGGARDVQISNQVCRRAVLLRKTEIDVEMLLGF